MREVRVEKKRRKKRKTDWYILLTPLFAVVALVAMLACFFTIGYYETKEKKAAEEAAEALAMAPVTYTKEEVDTMIESAVTSAVDEAVEAAVNRNNEDFLTKIRSKMENGDSTTSMLRELYPDNVVLYDKGKYVFKDIDRNLKASKLLLENVRADEESGEITYVEGEEIVSHKGIDVSKFQEKIDWSKVKEAGVEYAFLRLGIRGYTTGEIVLDETFEYNVEQALEQDLGVGVYFFSQAVTEEEALEEADFVIENLEPYPIGYPVVIDIEDVQSENARTNDLTAKERTEYVITFCERIKEAGYTPMIYGNLKTFMLMLEVEKLEEYEKWFAFYATDDFYYPYEVSVWQYSDSGKIDGIGKEVDLNISFKEW